MKRHLLSVSALVMLLIAMPVFAQSSTQWETSAQCKKILELPSVSPYVQKVLARADAGINFASSGIIDPGFLLPPWAVRVGSAWAKLIGSSIRTSIQEDDLAHNTACLRFDMAAIECKMDQVRSQMTVALIDGSVIAVIRLEKLLQFLNERYIQLSYGARDTGYQDPTWGIVEDFDPQVTIFCCIKPGDTCNQTTQTACYNSGGHAFINSNQCSTAGCYPPDDEYNIEDEMCPYTSDYGPPLMNGFGCDLDVMGIRTNFEPLQREYNALQLITNELNEFITIAQQFLLVQQSIDQLFGTTPTLPPPPEPREHIVATGCKWMGGVCEDDRSIRCMTKKDCESGTCIFPIKICEKNRNLRCFDDNDCMIDGDSLGPCMEDDGKIASVTELRGPFSIKKNHLQLLIDFLALRMQQGYSREYPDLLKYAQEFSASQSSERADRENDPYFNQFLRGETRLLYADWSRIQGQEEGDIFATASDPALEVAHALFSLRKAIGDLARLVTNKDKGLRSFIIKYSYFLRRSCVYRPCSASLDEVMKIAFADQCFPYTNGEYLSDTKDDPRSTKCAEDAEITIP